MKISNILAAVSLSTLFLSSCQREVDGILNPQENLLDSTMLKKYIELDTTLPAGLDTINKISFTYDSQERLTSSVSLSKDFSLPPSSSFPFFEKQFRYYNGNDTLPYKVIVELKDALLTEYDTIFLFYANGKVIRDSARSTYVTLLGTPTENITVHIFNDAGNTTQETVYISQTLSPSSWPPACPGTNVLTKTYTGANITSQTGAYTDCGGVGTSEINFIFDNHPNPLYRYRIPFPVIAQSILEATQKNNPTETWTFGTMDWMKYRYTYRSDGYPLIVRGYEVADPTNTWKGLFIYE